MLPSVHPRRKVAAFGICYPFNSKQFIFGFDRFSPSEKQMGYLIVLLCDVRKDSGSRRGRVPRKGPWTFSTFHKMKNLEGVRWERPPNDAQTVEKTDVCFSFFTSFPNIVLINYAIAIISADGIRLLNRLRQKSIVSFASGSPGPGNETSET